MTLDELAEDAVHLLDALRVKMAKAVIGVSLGEVTALYCALRFPERFEGTVPCDTSFKSLLGTDRIWQERIDVCEAE
jgi:pimeloyl-ACP methyl ester carboxylesterase